MISLEDYLCPYNIVNKPIATKFNETVHNHPGFQQFIRHLLEISKCEQDIIEILTNTKNLPIFVQAFTAPSVSESLNYEFFELIGDSHLNCAIVDYLKQRFPKLCSPKGVKFLARLKIEYVSKDKFSKYASKLNFDQFIRCSDDERSNGKVKRSIAEDCFEAFAGVVINLVDQINPFTSQKYCFHLIKYLMDFEEILLDPESLFDAKSRLKECFDSLKNYKLDYQHTTSNNLLKRESIFTTKILVTTPQGEVFIAGSGAERTKKASQQLAATEAIKCLKTKGLFKEHIVEI